MSQLILPPNYSKNEPESKTAEAVTKLPRFDVSSLTRKEARYILGYMTPEDVVELLATPESRMPNEAVDDFILRVKLRREAHRMDIVSLLNMHSTE